ncbi:transposable element Tcb2 transposase [Trichonephila clavipes]|nr:transposable element Tcb2 transposase [Trichonephila clavipes]
MSQSISHWGPTTVGSVSTRNFCVHKTCSRSITSYNNYRRPFSISFDPKEKDHTTVPRLVSDRLVASGRISVTNVRRRLHNAGFYARRPVSEISLGGHTDLYLPHEGALTNVGYRDAILGPYGHPFTGAIGTDFILMDDTARSHRAEVVEDYLEDHSLEGME